MALISYGIQLTSTPVNSGPSYRVYYSTNCSSYTEAGVVTLRNTSDIGYVDIEETSTCVKLVSIGNCTNEVVSGSTPSSSSYNTHLVTLTQKNGAGPEFIVSQDTGSGLFSYLDTIELAAQGATSTIEPSTSALAVRFRSNGVCQTTQTVQIGGVTPTPTAVPPTPTPTPTIGPTPTPTATPAPTPSTCYTFYTIYKSTLSATDACCNQNITEPVYLDNTSLATATVVYSVPNCSTLEPNPGYYTQNLFDYYYWTGASLVGPTSCPGCP